MELSEGGGWQREEFSDVTHSDPVAMIQFPNQ